MMSLYSHNDRLMCKIFPSSLGPIAMRWVNRLRKGSIRSFEELIQEFGARFITCNKVQQRIGALLSMKMRSRETLQSYTNIYWELYNEIGGSHECWWLLSPLFILLKKSPLFICLFIFKRIKII